MEYSNQVMNHFFKPKNMGKMKNPDLMAEIQNPICKDTMKIYIRIDKKSNKIKECKFQTIGCAAAISSSDVACELIKGKTLKEAKKINKKDILKKLHGLPKLKEHCSLLGEKAIKKAIDDYERKMKC